MKNAVASFNLAIATAGLLIAGAPVALAQAKASSSANSALAGFGSGNSKEPYKIDANKLEVQQTANKAVYSGDVIAIQGKMTMRCTTLVVFFNQNKPGAQPAAAQTPGAGGLKRLECHGPVTVNQEKQTATANLLVFENDIVTMTGNVVMSDGDNVQAGEKMTYHTKTQIGQMDGGRVRGIFTPGTDSGAKAGPKAGARPKT